MPEIAYIALGSNLGDRMRYLRKATLRLARLGKVVACSPVYETPPIGYEAQGPFLNAAIALKTELAPKALLHELKAIERRMGRTPGFQNGPRIIDLDILIHGQRQVNGEPTIPHPRMHERAFVLRPLLDLAPDIDIPGRGKASNYWSELPDKRLQMWEQSLDAPFLNGLRFIISFASRRCSGTGI